MTGELIIVFILSFFAFTLSAVCGGGAGLILMTVLGRVLSVSQIPGALSIGTLTSSASRLVLFKKNIYWKVVKNFVPAAIPAVWLGAWLLKFLNPVYLEIILGAFLVSNLSFLLNNKGLADEGKKPGRFSLSVIGFLAGFLSGLTGAVGLIFNKFYLSYGLSKEEIIATRAANELLLHLIKIILYSLFGLLTSEAIKIGCLVAAAAILSGWSIKWILPFISLSSFKKIGYWANGAFRIYYVYTGIARSDARTKD